MGFDSASRSWATEVDPADRSRVLVDDFPTFDGQLLVVDASLAATADDFGHAVSRRPLAVLRPGSVRDIQRLIRFARHHRIEVAARGQGHSTDGQAQVDAGVVIEMSALQDIHDIAGDGISGGSAWVDAGICWIDLIEVSLALGLRSAVSTDFIGLSVGGTLSVGGIGSHSPTGGAQVDNVLELEVVTGRGQRRRCSPRHFRHLFDAVRGGLGQFAVITKARVRLLPTAPSVRFYRPVYDSLAALMADLRTLMDDGRFDALQAGAEPAADGYTFYIEAAKDFAPGAEPDDGMLLAGLGFSSEPVETRDMPQLDYLNRLQPVIDFLQQIGVWGFPHPWLDLFLPASAAEAFIGDTLAGLDPADVNGPILINPHRRDRFGAPFLRLPDDDQLILFAMLRTAVPPTPERVAELVEANRVLYDRALAIGANSYRIDSLPFDRSDWERHFGAAWSAFRFAKRFWDPASILAPGQGIFTSD